MDFKGEWKKFLFIAGLFLACFYLPVGTPRFDGAVMESLQLVKWYARGACPAVSGPGVLYRRSYRSLRQSGFRHAVS